MFKSALFTAACTALFMSSGAFFAPREANAASSFMQACSSQWQQMKTAGTVPAGMKWSDFLKTCNAGSPTQASTAPAAPATPAVAAAGNGKSFMAQCGAQWKQMKTAGTVPAGMKWKDFVKTCNANGSQASARAAAPVTPAVVSNSSGNGQSFMQMCSAQWQQMKTAGTVPAGMKWTDFLKTCKANGSQAPVNTTASAPQGQQPQTAAVAPAVPVPARRTSGNGPQPSPGQLAEQSRIKECGSEWRTAKANNTLPQGSTWPQFWSACDARLKANHG
jgi:hypothetical protein